MKTKDQKREEALKRQIEYECLTFADRLARLDKYGHRAKKERARIKRQM